MSDATADPSVEPKKSTKLPLLLGVVLALVGAGGAFFAVSSGQFQSSEMQSAQGESVASPDALPEVAFVEVDPIMISLSSDQKVKHLRFRAQLEVDAAYHEDVEHVLPRVTDVLNGYLRALAIADLEDSLALIRIRSQMLRRVQLVVGSGRVRDLLIMEFVLN